MVVQRRDGFVEKRWLCREEMVVVEKRWFCNEEMVVVEKKTLFRRS